MVLPSRDCLLYIDIDHCCGIEETAGNTPVLLAAAAAHAAEVSS